MTDTPRQRAIAAEAAVRALAAACGIEDAGLAGDIARAVASAVAGGGAAAGAVDAALVPGQVYEARMAGDRTRRRAGGGYYTPPHLVDFAVEQTVGRALAGRTAAQSLSLRVLDPACGGGAFLVAALDRIERHVMGAPARDGDVAAAKTKFARHGAPPPLPPPGLDCFDQPSKTEAQAGAEPPGVLRGPALRRAIVARCLRGVDLDPVAVGVCRLALALAVDFDLLAGDRGRDALAGAGGVADVAADRGAVCGASVRRADALLDALPWPDGDMDAVVGNPPWGQKGVRFPDRVAAALRARFTTATGVLDPFKLFVERALELARPGGRWGMVLPDIVLLKDQQRVRDLMLDRSAIEWIVDCGRAFAGVNLDAVVIAGRRVRDRVPRGHRVSIWHGLPADWRARPPATRTLPQRVFGELPGHKLNIHLTPAAMRLLRKLADAPRLGDVFELHEGVHSGNARAKLFLPASAGGATPGGPGEQARPGEQGEPGEQGKLARLGKLIVGRAELARFRLRWAGAWLNLDPGALDRAAGEYANLGRPEWHTRPKLVVRRTGDRVIAAYDGRGYWVSNNAFVAVPRRPMSAAEQRAYAALLCSALSTWYFRTVQPRTGRLFAELKIHLLRAFPRPPEAAWALAVGDLARLVRRLERADDPAAEAAAEAAIDAAINAVIARLFGLSDAEAAMVEAGAR